MAAFTVQQLRDRLDAYVAAEARILAGQEYRIGDRVMKRADLEVVRQEIRSLSTQLEVAEARASGRSRIRYASPL